MGKDEQRLREVSVARGWNSGEIRAPEVKEVRRGDISTRAEAITWSIQPTNSKCDKKPLEPKSDMG